MWMAIAFVFLDSAAGYILASTLPSPLLSRNLSAVCSSRSLAGLIQSVSWSSTRLPALCMSIPILVGLLPKGNAAQLLFVYSRYKAATTDEGKVNASNLKETMSREVRVKFLGVW